MLQFDIKYKKALSDFNKLQSAERDKLLLKFKNKLNDIDIAYNLDQSEFKNIRVYHSRVLSQEIISNF